MLNEFIKELKDNQKINYKNNLENKIDIDYVIERLEDIEEETKSNPIDYILGEFNKLEKIDQYDLLYNACYNLIDNTKKEIYKEIKKDNGYHNIHLKTLYNELETLENIADKLEY